MLLGIISDTHGHRAYTLEAVRMLESLGIEALLHCGDIGSPEIVDLVTAWPTHFVFGNVDYDEVVLQAAIVAAGQNCHGRFAQLSLGGCQIAMLHGDDLPRLHQSVTSGNYDLVCHGHTHQAHQSQHGPTLLLNPGALYRATPHSIATFDTLTRQAMHFTL